MLRVSLAARLGLIGVIAVTMMLILGIAAYYLAQEGSLAQARPAPRQIAALVALVERAAPPDRAQVLEAVGSQSLTAQIIAADAPALPGAQPVSAQTLLPYQAALPGRALDLVSVPLCLRKTCFPRPLAREGTRLEFRIALQGGALLQIKTTSPLLVTRFGLPIGFGAGLFGTLVALVALLIMHRETRPIARLAAAADRMDPSGGAVALPDVRRSAPEIRALVRAFDRMQGRLADLLRARMAMMGGISHDVRTFATRLRLRVEAIPDPEERAKAVRDIADMIQLLDDALLASRSGAGELAEELVEFDTLLQAEVEDRRQGGAPVTLKVAAEAKGVLVLGDRIALRRVVGNLVENALKYGHAARLFLRAEAGTLSFTVEDDGEGIAAELRGVLLEPFVRLETSRNRSTGGAGLGLAIVANLVAAHGGTIAILDAPTGGAQVTVTLPRFVPGAQVA